MPEIPEPCQELAAEVNGLEQADAELRLELATVTGMDAWSALARLGQGRLQLDRKRSELERCVHDHTAALQANLVVMNISGSPELTTPTHVAHLWDATQSTAPHDTRIVNGHVFGFAGPLPAKFSISISTTGAPDVQGPDFRSPTLAVNDLASPLRIEAVIGPEISIQQEDVSRWWASFSPPQMEAKSAGLNIHVLVTSADAKLVKDGLSFRVSGQLSLFSMGSQFETPSFSASVTARLVPTTLPDATRICDLLMLDDLELHSSGYVDNISAVLLPLAKNLLRESLPTLLCDMASRELSSVIAKSFALSGLPPGVTLSLRRVTIDEQAIRLQPALGAIGDSLSTFVAPPLLPP